MLARVRDLERAVLVEVGAAAAAAAVCFIIVAVAVVVVDDGRVVLEPRVLDEVDGLLVEVAYVVGEIGPTAEQQALAEHDCRVLRLLDERVLAYLSTTTTQH